MNDTARKRSPRAPSIALNEAVERVTRAYDKEGRHATSPDIIAQHLGYKDSSSGASKSAIASVIYYGLIERRADNKMAVSKDIETYKFSPEASIKNALAVKWLKSVSVFNELLEKYRQGLPSDATVKYDLIERGFLPTAADTTAQVFKESVDWARYFDLAKPLADSQPELQQEDDSRELAKDLSLGGDGNTSNMARERIDTPGTDNATDRIPVRLSGGRRAWIEVPMPFFGADKARLKAQIDLILTDDEET